MGYIPPYKTNIDTSEAGQRGDILRHARVAVLPTLTCEGPCHCSIHTMDTGTCVARFRKNWLTQGYFFDIRQLCPYISASQSSRQPADRYVLCFIDRLHHPSALEAGDLYVHEGISCVTGTRLAIQNSRLVAIFQISLVNEVFPFCEADRFMDLVLLRPSS